MPDFPGDAVAIVGIGCRLPGGIESPGDFWTALETGRDVIEEISGARWNNTAFYHPDAAVLGTSYSRWAGLVKDPDTFDATFFGITPREARRLDPQQRWFLEACWRALEDAGQRIEDMRGRPIGVFAGCSSADYGEIQRHWRYHSDLHTNTGAAVSLIANRVSYGSDFRGPSLVVDTACSSSLVALDLAVRAIRAGQCEAALLGGVNALFMPEATIGFSKASMLARDGRCKAFDARADGYVRAEGAVALLLKPLDKALREGDRIYASVLSTAVNQDGESPGITVPNEEQQRALLDTAYRMAGVDPVWVGGVEAHGTGTPVGDPIEARALGKSLGSGRSPERPLWIGSVKTNLGHLEPASGAAGLAKLALSLRYGKFAPNLHFQSPNPEIDFQALGLKVATALESWPAGPDGHRYGGVNSFGFGGTNAHAVLASAPEPQRISSTSIGPIVWPFSARNLPALQITVSETTEMVQDLDEADIRRRAQAQARRRSAHPYRFALVAEDRQALLQAAKSADSAKFARRVEKHTAKPLFIFSGQGGQWHGMARELADLSPGAMVLAEQVAKLMPPVAGRPLLEALRHPDPAHADRTDVVQPLLFLQQLLLAEQLKCWGITATAVCGHSVGEIAAAYWAGALTLEDAVTIVHHRSRLQEMTRGSGAMAAIGLSAEHATGRLAGWRDLHLAAINAPELGTLAGDEAELSRLCERLETDGIFVQRLPMPYAFHSPHMDHLRDAMLKELAGIAPRQGQLPYLSTVTGSELTGSLLNADYWWRNLRDPVLFRDAVSAACGSGCEIAIELGPQPSLLRAARESAIATGQSLEIVPTLRRDMPAATALAQMLGQAWSLGLEPDWNQVYPGVCPHEDMPGHPWQRERYWLEAPSVLAYRSQPIDHPLLGRRIYGPGARWEQMADIARVPDLADHRLHGDVVFPAAGYVEQMLAAGAALFGDVPLSIMHLELDRLLVLSHPKFMHVERDEANGRVQIWSENGTLDEPWIKHCQARLLPVGGILHAPAFPEPTAGTAVSVEELYRRLEEGGNRYGPRFRCVRQLRKDANRAWGRIALDPASIVEGEPYRFHPALLDGALQMVLELLRQEGRTELYLPIGVDRIEVSRPVGSAVQCVVTNAYRRDGLLYADIYVYDDDGTAIALLEGCRCRAIENRANAHSGAQAYSWAWQPKAADPVMPRPCAWRLWGFGKEEGSELGALVGAEHVGPLKAPAPAEGEVICWFRAREGHTIADVREPVLAFAGMVQKLAGSNARLHVVTEGATWGHDEPTLLKAELAGVWALARSLLTERPVAMGGLTDLEPGTLIGQALVQIGASLGDSPPAESAWREGQRFEHQFRQHAGKLRERIVPTADCDGYGLAAAEPSFSALRWQRRPVRTPGPGQVTIAVEAAGLNFRDVLKVLDLYPIEKREWRWLGDECAGRIVAIGDGVEGFAPGDPVIAIAQDCLASQVVADARLVVHRPKSLPPEIAAGIPIVFLTAWYSLIECGRLRQGETVLVHAAAGGVGQAAIQIARRLGARVLATASPDKQPIVQMLGAEAVFNSRDLAFAEAVRAATGGQGVDLVLNSLAAEALLHGVELLKPFGRFIELGKRDIYANRLLDLRALRDNRAFLTVDLGLWIVRSPEAAGHQLRQIIQQLEAGDLQPVPTRVEPMREAVNVMRTMSQGAHSGKLVLRLDEDAAPPEIADPSAPIVRPDATYLITGGTSGLGLIVARFLAKSGARHLVLASRRGKIAPEDQSVLDEIADLGAKTYLRQCDVGTPQEVKTLLAFIRRELPRLRGIVHGAAVLDDVSVMELDASRLDPVLAAKAQGAWNLSAATQNDALDWFLMQGSIAAQLGAPGQSNYVVANHLLEALVIERRQRGLPAQLINWGPIADAGMVARSDRLRRYFELLGFVPLSSTAIEDAMDRVLKSSGAALSIFEIDWSGFAAAMPGFASDSRFRDLLEFGNEIAGNDLAQALRGVGPERCRQLIAKIVTEQVATVLGLDAERVTPSARLSDLGLDSLMTFELFGAFEAKLGKRLPLSVVRGDFTVNQLVDSLAQSFTNSDAPQADAPTLQRSTPVPSEGAAGYLRLRYLPPALAADPDMRFEAAALTYIPDDFEIRGGLGSVELRAAFGDNPFLSGVIDSPIGRVGAIMLPLRGRDLFADRGRTVQLVHDAMRLAGDQGSHVTTLTGLLPAATSYGEAITMQSAPKNGQALTTGHALTTAIIISNLVDLLHLCGRSLDQEALAIVGLGSVGRSVLELMLRVLPHPRALVMCDLYRNNAALEAFRKHIEQHLNFRGRIRVVSGDAGLPPEVLDTRLIVAAVDRTGLIDPMQLKPGTILLDDSYPAAFSRDIAWRRMDQEGDAVIASGGFARLPGQVSETLYVPATARVFLERYGKQNFLDYFRRDPRDYTACVFSGPLALRDVKLQPAVGIPTPEALQAFYAALEHHGLGPATPHCAGRRISDALFERMTRHGRYRPD